MEAVLEARNVSKSYGAARVLRDVSFEIAPGSATVLTGRSGSGKSTLFKLAAGLDRPSSGAMLVEGVDISSLADDEASRLRLQRIGLVFQSFNLLPDLSVLQNVRLPLDLAGVPRAEASARARELLDHVHVSKLADRRPNLLSGGEAQRVAIARALANRPALLVADEPTGSLDRDNAENVLRVFDELNREQGVTLFVVTHDPLAMRHFSHRLHIEDGQVARVS